MPIYDYLCDKDNGGCGHRFETIQSFTENALQKCPICKKKKLRRVFGVPGLSFIGSGFYVNDYRKTETKEESSGNP